MPARVVSPELVGRTTELAAIVRALEGASTGRGQAVLVGGEAGVGKTRLLAAAIEQAGSGTLILAGGCIGIAEGTLPFAPIIEAVRPIARILGVADGNERMSLRAEATAEELLGISAQLGTIATAGQSAAAELRPEWARSNVYEAFFGTLRRLSAERPLVLAIEDLHWADSSTRELLAFLIRNLGGERILVVGTYRSDELHRRHPLLRWLVEIDRSPQVLRLELPRLAAEDVARQVEGILGHTPEVALVDRIYARSEGNPFFVEELVAAGADTTHLPATLREVLAARLGRLSDAANQLLGVAAIIGRSVAHDLLLDVLDLEDDAIDNALREAVNAQILSSDHGTPELRFAFRHALLAEAAAETILPGQKRRLHARIAGALAAGLPAVLAGRLTGASGASGASSASSASTTIAQREESSLLAEVAHHWFEARELERAFAASSAAAEAAFRAGAYAESLGQYQRAVELWEVVADPEASLGFDRVELLRRTAQAAQIAGAYAQAIELLRDAIRRAEAAGEAVRAGLLLERAGRSLWTAGAFGEALATYQRALDLVPEDPPTVDRVRVVAGFAQMLMLAGQSAESRARAESALSMARSIGARALEGHLRSTLAAAMAYGDDAERAVGIAEEALAIAEEVGDSDGLGRAYAALTCALDFAGHRQEGAEIGVNGAQRLRKIGMGATYGEYVLLNGVQELFALGRWGEAMEHLRGAEARTVGTSRLYVYQVLAHLMIRRGDLDGSARALDAAAAFLGDGVEAQFTAPISVGQIMLAMLRGDVAGGRAVVDRILPLLARTDDLPRQMDLLLASSRLEADEAERARAARDSVRLPLAIDRAAGFLARLRGFACRPGSQARYHAWILALAEAEQTRIDGLPDPGAWRAALEAGAVDAHAWDTLYSQFRLSEALLAKRTGREEAAVILGRTHGLAASLGARPLQEAIEGLARRARIPLAMAASGVPAPAGVPVSSVPASAGAGHVPAGAGPSPANSWRAAETYGLTPREVEVLRLLALGRTNRQIGAELFIAEGTAGVHVSRIISKLEVTNRVEAGTIGERLGLGTA